MRGKFLLKRCYIFIQCLLFNYSLSLNYISVYWRFGLGTIFSKQEQYSLAELHFKRALQINPQNSALMCHIGVVQHALKKTDQALKTLNTALVNDPDNTLCKFHRASINFSIGRHMEALREFEELKNIIPKESLVYYSIGKVKDSQTIISNACFLIFFFLTGA